MELEDAKCVERGGGGRTDVRVIRGQNSVTKSAGQSPTPAPRGRSGHPHTTVATLYKQAAPPLPPHVGRARGGGGGVQIERAPRGGHTHHHTKSASGPKEQQPLLQLTMFRNV
jgi:hypothetical protein